MNERSNSPALDRSPGAKALRRKLDIMRGAAVAFRDRGYAATSVRDIARLTGMTPGNLYYYFRNKQEILCFCQDYSLDLLLRQARRIRRKRVGPEEKIRELIRTQMLCMLDELHGSAGHIEFHAIPPLRLRRIIAKRDEYEGVLRSVVREGVRQGQFAPCDEKLVSLAILGAVNWSARWFRADGSRSPEAIADSFVDYLVRGLMR